MKFISIDSSLAHTGVAIGFYDSGQIRITDISLNSTEKTKNKQVRASSDTIDRCRDTHNFIHNIIVREKPDVIFMETPSGSQSASGMKSYGATCQLIAGIKPAPIEVTPIEVKKASVGSQTASKRQMIDWAHHLYGHVSGWLWHAGKLQDKNEHMADAIAIAYAAVKTQEFERLLKYFVSCRKDSEI